MQYKCKSIHCTSITFDPVNGFEHSKGHFGVVFHGQSSCEVQSAVTVQISWLQTKYNCIFGFSGQIWTYKGLFQSSFSRQIQSWGTINQLWLYKSNDFKINIMVSLDPVDGFGHSKGHFRVVFQGQSNHDIRLSIFTINWACSPVVLNLILYQSRWCWGSNSGNEFDSVPI